MSHSALLRTRRFAPFFWTQFQGALNDNVFKNALVILFAFGAGGSTLSTDTLVNLAGGIFILPFFLFSATAGQLADKLEKSRIIRAVKLLEIGIMSVAAVGFAFGSVAVLLAALFLMGVHSTLFGPVKYSILPQHLREEELVGGNALIEGATFVAILVGTIVGGILVSVPGWGPALVAAVTIGLAITGWLTSRGVPPRRGTSARAPDRLEPASPRRCARSASRARTARCSCRSSASRGSGSTARSFSRSSPASAARCSPATSTSSRCC